MTEKARSKCVYGHKLSGNNLGVWTGSDGYERRYCRACAKRRKKRYNERHKK